MTDFLITVHLSKDFRRTCILDDFEGAAADGVYDGDGFSFAVVDAADHMEAAEIAFGVCNSSPAGHYEGTNYPAELHCSAVYEDVVAAYRKDGNRSLSVGDMVMIFQARTASGNDGRYGVASMGFKRF